MQKTAIEYLDYTWNPLAMRCSPVSEGCEHCWHLRMADRLAANPKIGNAEAESYAGHDVPLVRWTALKKPITAKMPGRIGVQLMGDLFHLGVDFGMVHEVFDVMWQSPHHTFLVLTKRPERMFEFMTQKNIQNMYGNEWPLKNVWLGVSCENQARADERIPILLQIPAAVRWVSIEPMLGAVDISPWDRCDQCGRLRNTFDPYNDLGKPWTHWACHEHYNPDGGCDGTYEENAIDWVVLGGETGPGARPMHPDWVRSVRDQCVEAGVPFYFKQWGEWALTTEEEPFMECWTTAVGDKLDTIMARCGKKRSGHLLDGREWREMPEAVR